MKRSALHRWHQSAGAALAVEDGWFVPLRYSTADQEAQTAASGVAICDLSHFHDHLSPHARFLIAGPRSRALLGKLTSLNPDVASAYSSLAHVRTLVTRHPLGYLIMPPRDYAESVWSAILHAGEEFHIAPFGLEAYRRLEA